ncbi:hypothetical protein TTHERM_00136160 (macronuclear) [Tetrahymena thermophila SB210]|uniref:Uncharacterized protein n=1 Tax=Tetrahymena thermophila (strain SB210) TaxID=312017 RepID=I7MKK5_TETTS|nr:hypothetical protein TTHERM_00136160 [Tetrahymena thermophila SB210]EAR99452.2 hypothetical protein TTHERM_00136160 [Tetrahymena thermophila SB210]|eukprot:XP_001019697.2 hypothetical protein TTHERM_00136160 [Tetrahymena thermophila SB210]
MEDSKILALITNLCLSHLCLYNKMCQGKVPNVQSAQKCKELFHQQKVARNLQPNIIQMQKLQKFELLSQSIKIKNSIYLNYKCKNQQQKFVSLNLKYNIMTSQSLYLGQKAQVKPLESQSESKQNHQYTTLKLNQMKMYDKTYQKGRIL